MPQDDLVYEGFSAATEAEQKERGSAAIAGLKHLMNV